MCERNDRDEFIEDLEVIVESGDESSQTFSYLSLLIIDHDMKQIQRLRDFLEFPGINIITTNSLSEATDLTNYINFSLILLEDDDKNYETDLFRELLRKKESTRLVPIFSISKENYSPERYYSLFMNGSIDVIFEPLNREILFRKVQLFLDIDIQKKLLERQTLLLNEKIVELQQLKRSLEGTNEILSELSLKDGLTNISNRRRFDEVLSQEWKRCERTNISLAMIMIDIDYFKSYNDTYGHQAGDAVLSLVAKSLEECIGRPYDLLARYGGEEFSVILPGSNVKGAEKVAKKMLNRIRSLAIPHYNSECADILTISLGCCSYLPDYKVSASDVIKCSDSALYQAKHKGRNCVVCFPPATDNFN